MAFHVQSDFIQVAMQLKSVPKYKNQKKIGT